MAERASGAGRRQLAVVAVMTVAGAGLAAATAALTWWSADYQDPLTGALTISLSGAACVPELIPLALVGLAGLGAVLATRGLPRRLIGGVLLLCGVAIAVRSAMSFASPTAALTGSLTRPADPVGAAQLHPMGPVLAVIAGLLLTTAGVLVGLGLHARDPLGARYDAPTKASAPANTTAESHIAQSAQSAVGDGADDPIDWWKALDAGDDPTTDAPAVSDQTSAGGYHDPNASRPT